MKTYPFPVVLSLPARTLLLVFLFLASYAISYSQQRACDTWSTGNPCGNNYWDEIGCTSRIAYCPFCPDQYSCCIRETFRCPNYPFYIFTKDDCGGICT